MVDMDWNGVERRGAAQRGFGARQAAWAGAVAGALGPGPLGVAPGAVVAVAARWAARPAAKLLGALAGAAYGWAKEAGKPAMSAGFRERPESSGLQAGTGRAKWPKDAREADERWERGREAVIRAGEALAREGRDKERDAV